MKLISTTCLILIMCIESFAQKSEFQLLDNANSTPIKGAVFVYGSQKGISNDKGYIHFDRDEGSLMKISHINYGTWELDNDQIQEILKGKKYFRKTKSIRTNPVTIIALRSNSYTDKFLDIDHQDRMEHDAAAILEQLPAFNSIRKSGGYGFDPVFRGYKYDQLNIVYNNCQGATAACPNRMDPPTSQMSPNMIERIEVYKGPHALRFGTGFGGSINFIPAEPSFTDELNLKGRFSSEFQDNGNAFKSEGMIGYTGVFYDFNIIAAWSQGKDYITGNGESVDAGYNRGSYGTNLSLKLSSDHIMKLSAVYNVARDADFPALSMDLRNDDTWLFNMDYNITFHGDFFRSLNTIVYGSYVNHLMDNLLKVLEPRTLNAETSATTFNLGFRTEGQWNIANDILYAGLDFKSNGADGTRVREFLMGPNAGKVFNDNVWQDGIINKFGIFSEYQLNTEKFQYILSARFDIDHSDINDPSDEFLAVFDDFTVTQINPNISMGINRSFSDDLRLGLWLGRAQRSASLVERFINYFAVGYDPYEIIGNPLLDPEINNELDLIMEWKKKGYGMNIDLFASYIQNYISSKIDTSLKPRLPMSPGVRTMANIDNAFKAGFEINFSQELVLGMKHHLGIAFTYAQDIVSDKPLPEIPPLDLRYTLTGNYFNNKLFPELNFHYAMKQKRISDEFGESSTPAFMVVDVKVSYYLADKIKLNLGIYNLFDENYYEHLSRSVKGTTNYIYSPGRNLFGSISLEI